MQKMDDTGIMTRQGTHPVSHQSYYKKKYSLNDAGCFNSFIAEKCSIALPLYPGLSEEDIFFIASKLRSLSEN